MAGRATIRFTGTEVARLMGVVRDAQGGSGFRERWAAIEGALRTVAPFTALNVGTLRWPAMELPSGLGGLIRFRDGEARGAGHHFGRNFDARAMTTYLADYAEVDPTASTYLRGHGQVHRHSEIVGPGAWGRDACTGEFLPRHGARHLMGVVAPVSPAIGLSLGLYRDGGRNFTDREVAALQAVVPDLIAATRRAIADELACGAPTGRGGSILLSGHGEVEAVDAAARALLRRLAGPRPPSAVLAAVVRDALRDRASEARALAPLRGGGWLELTGIRPPSLPGKVAVFLRPLESGTQPHFDAAADGAGLSPRERHVAALAVRGLANKEIARDLGITIDTAKGYLSSAYRKTRADGRAALVAYLLGGGS